MSPPLWTVVVPVSRNESELRRLLDSFRQQDLNPNEWELLWVGAAERVNSPQLAAPFTRALAIESREANFLRNAGIRAARGRWIFLIDDDCWLPSEASYLRNRQATHEHHGPSLLIGSRYLSPPNDSCWSRAYNEMCHLWSFLHRDAFQASPYLVAGNLSFSREGIQKLNLQFESPHTYGGDELEFLKSAQAQGCLGLYLPNLGVFHRGPQSRREFFRKAKLQGAHRHQSPEARMDGHRFLVSLSQINLWPIYLWVLAFVFWMALNSRRAWAKPA